MAKTNEIIEFYRKASQATVGTEKPIVSSEQSVKNETQEPFQSFVVSLAETLKKQQIKPVQKPTKKKTAVAAKKQINEEVKVTEHKPEPLQSFIASLAEVLKHEKLKQQPIIEEELIEEEPVVEPEEKETEEEQPAAAEEYVKVLAKGQRPIVEETEEEKKIKSIVSEQITQQSNLIKSQYPNIGMGGGGGGTNAVQFAEGGTMRGDLNVMGKYLSGGIDLGTLIGASGGGSADSLISGTQMVKLSSNGSFVFNVSDNNIVLTTPLGYTWTFDNNGVLSGPMNSLEVTGLNTIGTMLSAGIDLFDIFLQRDVIDGGLYS